MLDELVGSLTFDPLAFSRMPPKDKLAVLRGFVTDVDFEAEAAADRGEYQQRRDQNRMAKDSRVRMAGIQVPEVEGGEPSVGDAHRKLQEAREHNERRRDAIAGHDRGRNAVAISQKAVERLRFALKDAEQELHSREKALAEMPPPEAEKDQVALSAALAEAQRLAEAHRERRSILAQRSAEKLRAEAAEAESKHLTEAMDARAARLAKAVADADMPVPALSLTQDGVLLEGLPLEQASDAEQLRLSCSIAMAQNAKLRVIRVRNGSLLDEDSMAILREMAEDRDYQVWIEMVDTTGKVGIVIEAGKVKA